MRHLLRFWAMLFLFSGLGGCPTIRAQDIRAGLPHVVNYSPEDYGAETQNWAAVQDHRGLLYVANNQGVLEFDGEAWQLIKIGTNLAARSLAVDASGRVFVGALGDFGYLQPDAKGQMKFVSLAALSRLAQAEIGDVITTAVSSEGTFFQSALGVFLVASGKLQIHKPTTRFHLSFVVHDRFFVRERGKGLLELKSGQLVLVEGGEIFQDDRVFCMLPRGAGEILVGSQLGGFQVYRPWELPPERFVKAPGFSDLEKILKPQKVSICDLLPDGRIVLGTTQSGLYILSPNGKIQYHLDKAQGLQDNSVYYVYVDHWGNVVACLNVGISMVEVSTPFTFVDGRLGISGSGNAAFWHPGRHPGEKDQLVCGTSQGLFLRDAGDLGFRKVPGSQETWAIRKAQGVLLVCHSDGVAELKGGQLKPILSGRICISMVSPRNRPDLVLVGTLNGITVLEFTRGAWHVKGEVAGFVRNAFSLSEDMDGSIWLETQNSDGLFRLFFSEDYSRVSERHYTTKQGLPALDGNFPFQGRDQVFFMTTKGAYRFLADRDAFEPDPRFPETAQSTQPIRSVSQDQKGNLLIVSRDLMGRYLREAGGGYRLERGALPRLRAMRPSEFSTELVDGTLLIGFKDGFILADEGWVPPKAPSFRAFISKVQNPVHMFYGGAWNAAGKLDEKAFPPLVLPFRSNLIRFDFGAPFL
ncbi:MAG: hypothetical protein Q8O00_02075, partial [Holophaga sp.]|nr:hypothetical protein [Holophaga sp.]